MRTLALFPAALLCLACAGHSEAPPRPPVVPGDSHWVAGKDQQSGVFVRLRTVGGLDWRVEVWSDVNGHKLSEGRYLVKGAALGELKPEDLDTWDGEAFSLRGGGSLERAR